MADEGIAPSALAAAQEVRAVIGRVRRRIREATRGEDLTPSQTAVVTRLDRDGPMSASDLAAAERVRPQSMAAWLSALDEHGWIERRPDPDDGRRQLISLSETGRAQLTDGRRERSEWLARVLNDEYSEQERQQILDAMALLDRLTRS
ncbi:DNA-binding MarR family transcriptional regulator [Amycolatopsis bartoniae]|nr:MarR family transcriptional regulator [Amycolatopsis bartoniae]MBB2938935.1 DNA-binding MarR family transcriptional regulator [Amycolatopsis bartoniae]